MKIHSIYDNGGETFDRFTVFFTGCGAVRKNERGEELRLCLGMSEDPKGPQGFGQHCEGQPGANIGRRIRFEDLPTACRAAINEELVSFLEG